MIGPPSSGRCGTEGFTLIELMISLGLFALIAVAGLALVDSVLGVQERTEVRLDRLAALQRALYAVSSDLEQVAPGRITGGGEAISFTRTAPGLGGPPVAMRYEGRRGTLLRVAGGTPQVALPQVASVRWRFFADGWQDRWPPSEEAADAWPQAIELELRAAGPGGEAGTFRRVVVLPSRSREAS